jgi:FtsP/CotA-like multicopper oxidase with cupredoxin domain
MRSLVFALLMALGLSCSNPDAPKVSAPAAVRALGGSEPGVRKYNLVARIGETQWVSGKPSEVWRYDDAQGGPLTAFAPLLLEGEVGDRLEVTLRNELPTSTTIHWHGLRLPVSMDGNPHALAPAGEAHKMHADSSSIAPGGSFTYAFTLKDEGLFWFHPHARSDVQVDKGLYGMLRVRAKGETANPKELEQLWALDDVALDPSGAKPSCAVQAEDHDLVQLGRGGATILLNGALAPTFDLDLSKKNRLRIVNVANGRFFRLQLAGFRFRIVGTDGGAYPKAFMADELVLVPGERVDAYLEPATAQLPPTIELLTLAYDRGHGSKSEPVRKVATIRVSGTSAPSEPAPPPVAPSIAADAEAQYGAAKFAVTLGQPTQPASEEPRFTVNGKTWPLVDDIPVSRTLQSFVVENTTAVPHPFHLHGTFFTVLLRDGLSEPAERRARRDTMLIPAKSKVLLETAFDEPGLWMYHCHILEHAEHGMMGHLKVE